MSHLGKENKDLDYEAPKSSFQIKASFEFHFRNPAPGGQKRGSRRKRGGAGLQDPSCVKSGVKVQQSWRTWSSAGEFDQAHSQCRRQPGSSGHFLLLSADMPDGGGKLLVQQDFILLFTVSHRLN